MDNICSIEECSNKIAARGWCWKHYARWKRHGDPLGKYQPPPCSVEGCERLATARGWCDRHYARFIRLGDPVAGSTYFTDVEERFAEQTEWRGDCLIWTGATTQHGYGYMSVDGKSLGVHRYVWEKHYGPIPDGLEVDHEVCHNRACCNKDHLRLAEPYQNRSHRRCPTRVSASGVRNVYRIASGRYEVHMTRKGERFHFGYFDTLEEAEQVAKAKRKEVFGDFAGR